MACIIKKNNSPYYYVRYQDSDSKIVDRSTKSRNYEVAKRIRNKIEDEFALKRFNLIPITSDLTVKEWVDEFYRNQERFGTRKPNKPSTLKRLHGTIDPFIESHSQVKLMRQFTQGLIRNYVIATTDGTGKHSVYNELKNLKVFFNACEKMHNIPAPTKGIPNPKPRRLPPNIYLEDEIRKMVAVKDTKELAILLLDLQAGFRAGEMGNAKWNWIDCENDKIRVKLTADFDPKDSDTREMPLKSQLKKALLEWRKVTRFNKDDDYIFPNNKGRPYKRKFTEDVMKDILGKLSIEGDCKKFRDTFASYSLACGAPLQNVRDWLGHEKVGTTDFYMKHLPKPPATDIRKLFGWISK
jgi:integrase